MMNLEKGTPDLGFSINMTGVQDALNSVNFAAIERTISTIDVASVENTIGMINVDSGFTNNVDPSALMPSEQMLIEDEQAIQHDYGY